jgi:hypothetical protein
MLVKTRLNGLVDVTGTEALDAEKDLPNTAHLDLLGALGDPVATVMTVDVLCKSKNV